MTGVTAGMTAAVTAGMTAVVPVRGGRMPVGARETVAEAGGRCWIVGSGVAAALEALEPVVTVSATLAELGSFAPGQWAAWLAPRLPAGSILLPHSADGRDLAPRLAAELGWPLVAGAVRFDPTPVGSGPPSGGSGDGGPGRTGSLASRPAAAATITVARYGNLAMDVVAVDGPVVATLQIGVRSADVAAPPSQRPGTPGPEIVERHPDQEGYPARPGPADPIVLGELEADRATMDLADATRIVAAGAGLGDRSNLVALEAVAVQLGASVGATRVVTDWGWLPVDRQIGTTGVTVDPRLYLAVGISGAVQHTAGLGQPAHVVAVNTDGACPMMELADLALVCDGPAYLEALEAALTGIAGVAALDDRERPEPAPPVSTATD